MRSRPSHNFLRSASRKSRRRAVSALALALTAVLFLVASGPLSASPNEAQATLRVHPLSATSADLLLDIGLAEYDPAPVSDALRDGLRSEIQFLARVYGPRRGLLRILGDRLMTEQVFSYEAYWDIFERRYVLISDGAVERFADEQDFLSAFFSVSRLRVALGDLSIGTVLGGGFSVAAQVRLTPVKLVPALGILSFVMRDEVVSTAWTRCNLDNLDILSAVNGGALPCEINERPIPR